MSPRLPLQNEAACSKSFDDGQTPNALSHSQLRVCQLLGAGQKAVGIAELMGISITTVRSHLRNIYIKTNTTGQFEVIALINRTAIHTDYAESMPL